MSEARYKVGDVICVDPAKSTDETQYEDGYLWLVERVSIRNPHPDKLSTHDDVYYRCKSMQTGDRWNWFEDELCD